MASVVRDNTDESRYEILEDGALAGFTEYHLHGGVIAFLHTEVDAAFSGRGLAKTLIRGALDDARQRGLEVQPFCSFVRRFITENRDYADLVRESEWERFGLSA
jgi:predicted GNAT family acetyltransferase